VYFDAAEAENPGEEKPPEKAIPQLHSHEEFSNKFQQTFNKHLIII